MMLPNVNELREAHATLVASIDRLTDATLRSYPAQDQIPSLGNDDWEPFVLVDGGACTAGAVTVGGGGSNLIPAGNGWQAQLERVSVSIDGTSPNAVAAICRGNPAPANLIDRMAGVVAIVMNGATFYVNVSEFTTPPYFDNGQQVSVAVSGAASTANVIVRIEGRRRMVKV